MAKRPIGLEAIYSACAVVYSDQPNPLQMSALVKFWLGGPDPLDFINIYRNNGDKKKGIQPHWHYVTCGLSDLYGDGRVHEVTGVDQPSGFGFELSFRLLCRENSPPTWPAELLQSLARYVFQSENLLCAGDHVSWHAPLDKSDSSIQQMLLSNDPQLEPVSTPLGCINFIQIVGVTNDELAAAQKWNVQGILDLLKKNHVTGGEWLLTDMRRGESLFEVDPDNLYLLDRGISEEGSSLSGVSAVCSWADGTGRKAAGAIVTDIPNSGRGPVASIGCVTHGDNGFELELLRTQTLSSVHLEYNLEAGILILLALRGRLQFGRHFTFKSFTGDVAITLVCPGIEGAFADEHHRLAAQGPWLQVYLSEEDIRTVLKDISVLQKDDFILPHTFEWNDINLSITVHPNDMPTSPSAQPSSGTRLTEAIS